jgi:hypothetical protein
VFEHLFHGSPPWLLTILTVGLATHIGSGPVAILSGAGALAVRKGGRAHGRFGTVFLFAMLTMAIAASLLAMVAVERGHLGQMANVFGGVFAFYLVMTGWLTVRRDEGVVGRAEIGGCAGAMVIAAVALFWLLPMTLGPEGRAQGVPVAAPFILVGVAALLAILDLKVILAGGVTGVSRILRHLWRMCLGLFIAAGSFFIGQQKDMPAFMQGSPVLLLLGFAPLIAMVFWLFAARRGATRHAPDLVSVRRGATAR